MWRNGVCCCAPLALSASPSTATTSSTSFGRRPRRFLIAGPVVLRGFEVVLGDEIDRTLFDLGEDLADVFAHDADHDQLHAAEYHQADDERRIAWNGFLIDEGLDHDDPAEDERAR